MPEPVITLRDVARRAGVHPATASRALSPETRLLVSDATAQRVFEQRRARNVDGDALATARLSSPVLAEAARAGLNVVLMNRVAEDYDFPAVSVDNERGAQMAVAHLARLGHTRIGYIAGPQSLSTGLT